MEVVTEAALADLQEVLEAQDEYASLEEGTAFNDSLPILNCEDLEQCLGVNAITQTSFWQELERLPHANSSADMFDVNTWFGFPQVVRQAEETVLDSASCPLALFGLACWKRMLREEIFWEWLLT